MRRLKAGILFGKILILEKKDKVIVGFIMRKKDFEKIKTELEKLGEVFTEELINDQIRVEVHTVKPLVHKVLKAVKNIELFPIGNIVENFG
jgi:hypothetical protein